MNITHASQFLKEHKRIPLVISPFFTPLDDDLSLHAQDDLDDDLKLLTEQSSATSQMQVLRHQCALVFFHSILNISPFLPHLHHMDLRKLPRDSCLNFAHAL